MSLTLQWLSLPENQWLQNIEPKPFTEWVNRYPLNRRTDLTSAYNHICSVGLEDKDAIVNCFIKNEVTVRSTDPRNISPRSDRFLAALGPYISAIEDASHVCEYLVKGKTMHQRDTAMAWLLDFPIWIETDYSRLDMTVNNTILTEVEIPIFEHVFHPQQHVLFANALALLVSVFGYSPLGYFYEVEGERCSGDAHTSIGNGLDCAFFQWLCFRAFERESWRSAHEGDDGIVGLHKSMLDAAHVSYMQLATLGLKCKIIVQDQLEKVTFCGRLFSRTPLGITSHANVERCLGKFHITTSHLPPRRALLAKALSYWHTDHGTPIIGQLCHKIITLLTITKADVKAFRNCYMDNFTRQRILSSINSADYNYVEPTAEARTAVSLYNDFDPDLQIAFESHIKRWAFIPSNPDQIIVEPLVDDEHCTYYGPQYPQFAVGRVLKESHISSL
jgi:hypothetical protein